MDKQRIDTLEQRVKDIASELYNKEIEVGNLTACIKDKESLIRSFAKKNFDLEKKVDENTEEEVQRRVVGQGYKKKPFSELGLLQKRRVTQPVLDSLQSVAKDHQIEEAQLVGKRLAETGKMIEEGESVGPLRSLQPDQCLYIMTLGGDGIGKQQWT